MVDKSVIQGFAKEIFSEVQGIRRHLHQYPELSFEEHRTASFIAETLQKNGITNFETGMAGTGIVGTIVGEKGGNNVLALRADIDALPIAELNDVSYTSKNSGIMHACGHDVHTASLLGTLIILNKLKNHFGGTIKFIFQPGEEKLPGGASILIKEGVLENPKVDHIIGQHVFPELSAGKVGFRPGMYMASTDEIYIKIIGKGGHGAMPHQTVDPILLSANILSSLQQIVSRRANPITPSVLSFGKIEGLGATNVIPGEVNLEGTFRTFDESWRDEAHALINQLVTGMCAAAGATCDVKIIKGYPALQNDVVFTEKMKQHAVEFLGEENVIDLPMRMTAEDFAFYSQQVPACFYRLGVRNEELGITHGVHHPNFNIDEQALITSVGLMTWLSLAELQA